MKSSLLIEGLRVRGRAGCQDAERVFPQVFTFQLELRFDAREALRHDHVSYAPDYERAAALVRELLARSECG